MRKRVLITGGTGSLGSSLVSLFAENNYDIYLNYFQNEEEANKIKSKYKSLDIDIVLLKADISNEDEVKIMLGQIDNLDVIINNAGIAIDNNYLDKSSEEFNKVLNINLTGTFLITKYAARKITKGSIINISSSNAIDTYYPESIDYDAAKAGVISLTHNFANILGPDIRVNCVCPGWINTNMTKGLSPDFKKQEEEKIILSRFADPKEIADLVLFLASEEASYITDSIIKIDGGVRR